MQRNMGRVLLAMAVGVLAGCDGGGPNAPPPAANQNQAASDGKSVTVEVVGVYREADRALVRDSLDALLGEGSKRTAWSASGNRMTFTMSPVVDVDALAKRIEFGEATVDGRTIRVVYSESNRAPEIALDDRFDGRFSFNDPPDDPLGPALAEHNGDWSAALKAIRADFRLNDQQEVIELDMPAFKTTDESMKHIGELTALKTLSISMCDDITDQGAQHLAKLTELEELNLFGTEIGNAGQAHLSGLTGLKQLKLSGKGTEEGLRHLKELNKLEELEIGFGLGYPVTVAGLQHLAGMTGLTRLRLDGCGIDDRGLALIAKFDQLQSLHLKDGKLTDAGMAHLAGLVHLRSLGLENNSGVGNDGLAYVKPLVKLSYLNLLGTGLTDEGITVLEPLAELSSLSLAETQITDAGVRAIPPLPKLRQLILDGTQISDAALAHLRSFPKLSNLWLSETAITDEGLKTLAHLSQLETLQISGTAVTDAGMAHLAGLTKLRTLDLSETAVTEQGLSRLSALRGLRNVQTRDSGISQEELQQFNSR